MYYMTIQPDINNKTVAISTTVTLSDYNYCKHMHLKFSRLLANAINVHRVAYNEGVDENYFNYMKRKIEILNQEYQKVIAFLHSKNLIDEYDKIKYPNTE